MMIEYNEQRSEININFYLEHTGYSDGNVIDSLMK